MIMIKNSTYIYGTPRVKSSDTKRYLIKRSEKDEDKQYENIQRLHTQPKNTETKSSAMSVIRETLTEITVR